MKKSVIAIILVLIGLVFHVPSYAQREIRISPSFVVPLGELNTVYQPTVGIALSSASFNSYRNKRSGSNWEVGYHRFSPEKEIFYFGEDQSTTMRYDDYHVLQLSLNFLNQHFLTKSLTFDWGFGLGIYYVKYEYEMDTPYLDEDAFIAEPKGALRLQSGFSYDISKNVGVGCYSQYSLMIGKPSEQGYFQHSISNSLNVYYRF